DVVAAGAVTERGRSRDFAVVKLDGATGAPRWRYTLDGGARSLDRAFAVALDRNADVLAAGYTRPHPGSIDSDFTVVKLTGATGDVVWDRRLHGTASVGDVRTNRAFTVAGAPQRDAISGGGPPRPSAPPHLPPR